MNDKSEGVKLLIVPKRLERARYLDTLNKKQLQALCRKEGIPVSNNNIDMRNRLLYK